MKKCIKCDSYSYVIMAKTEFGQGDSTTEVYCECRDCGHRSPKESQWDFPATYDLMRKAQANRINEKEEI